MLFFFKFCKTLTHTPNHCHYRLQSCTKLSPASRCSLSWTSANPNSCIHPLPAASRGVSILRNAEWQPPGTVNIAQDLPLAPRIYAASEAAAIMSVSILQNVTWRPRYASATTGDSMLPIALKIAGTCANCACRRWQLYSRLPMDAASTANRYQMSIDCHSYHAHPSTPRR